MSASDVGVDDLIRVERQDGLTIITLDRPDRRNGLTPDMQLRLDDLYVEADRDASCRVVIITGAGSSFCAGADLETLGMSVDIVKGAICKVGPRPVRASLMSKPVIAAVNGPAVGLGLVHAIAADIRVASSNARFISAFAQLGLVAEYGLAWFLQRQIGLSRATEVLLTGRTVGADEALSMGLVQSVVPPEQLMDTAIALAQGMATKCSPQALAAIKSQLRLDASRPEETAVLDALQLIMPALDSGDLWEVLAARAESRDPRFAGICGEGQLP